MGQFDGFFLTETGIITVTLIILIVGAVVGFVGAWTKRSRVKALEQYEKQQKIGKNKKKGKK
jgi:Na+-transporting methylmalonyl-CoA/oxaloacetate decarboxylase gamma subunit